MPGTPAWLLREREAERRWIEEATRELEATAAFSADFEAGRVPKRLSQ